MTSHVTCGSTICSRRRDTAARGHLFQGLADGGEPGAEVGRCVRAVERDHSEVVTAEGDDRDARRRIRRVNEAKFLRTKRLGDLDLPTTPQPPPATLAHLASCAWVTAVEPVVLLGDRHGQDPPTVRARHRRRRTRDAGPLRHHRRPGQ